MSRPDGLAVRSTTRAFEVAAATCRRVPFRGRVRLGWSAADALGARQWDNCWTVRMRWGAEMTLPWGAKQAWVAAFSGAYDEAERELLASFIEPGAIVIDVGASLGLWTVPLAIAARRAGARVIAFEPVPDNVAMLRANIERNGLADVVEIREVALGSEPGEVTLSVESWQGGNAAVAPSSTDERLAGPASARVSIERLDDLPAPADGPSPVIKMDVEGYEMDVLEGAPRFVALARPVIFGEFHPGWFAARHSPAGRLTHWCRLNEYRAHRVVRNHGSLLTDRRRLMLAPMADVELTGEPLLLVPAERPVTHPVERATA